LQCLLQYSGSSPRLRELRRTTAVSPPITIEVGDWGVCSGLHTLPKLSGLPPKSAKLDLAPVNVGCEEGKPRRLSVRSQTISSLPIRRSSRIEAARANRWRSFAIAVHAPEPLYACCGIEAVEDNSCPVPSGKMDRLHRQSP
jgi:hypothetical protein